MKLQILLDLVPVALAVAAVCMCAQAVRRLRRAADRIVMALACVCAMLLIVAQSSWWAARLAGNLEDTEFSNWLWLLFNCGTMLVFVLLSRPRGDPHESR